MITLRRLLETWETSGADEPLDTPAVRAALALIPEGANLDAAFPAWHAIVTACQRGDAGAAEMLAVARVVVHQIGGKPLDSVAAWVTGTLERQAKLQEHSLAEIRERARVELVEDADRLGRRPEMRLRTWEQAVTPIKKLVDRSLDELGRELARSVLVTPRQDAASARAIVDRLVEASPATAAERLAACDAINALACIGVEIPSTLDARLTEWLPGLVALGAPLSSRIRAGLAALAYGDIELARHFAPARVDQFVGGLAFTNDILAVLDYIILATRADAVSATLDNALHRVVEEIDALCTTEQLDEPTLLWLARVVFQRLDHQPLGEIAMRAHEWLWRVPRDLEEARHEASTRVPAPPLRHTFDRGRFQIDRPLMGSGAQRLCRGVDMSTGERLLISYDEHSRQRQNVDELRNVVDYRVHGVFELAFVGTPDQDPHHWAIVERVTAGAWLPHVLGPAEPWSAPEKAIQLGLSAGLILERAAAAGVILAEIRPEFVWADRTPDGLRVTGLSARAPELFRRRKGEQITHPLFERWYRAPEAGTNPDDRSVAFALAVSVAEWATGRYPLRSAYGRETAAHHPIEAPPPLRALLERTIVPTREDRPSLREFVAELARLG